jgi:ABC-type Fe3+-hydroxamate transport system substrate-binding protein
MKTVRDQLNEIVQCKSDTVRIVSLVPSLTEVLSDLDLEQETVGVTKFCVHPKHWKSEKVIVGGTKKFHHDRIDELKPTLIIANKEENTPEDISQLKRKYPVYVSNIKSVNDCLHFIADIGLLCNKPTQAQNLIVEISEAASKIQSVERGLSVAYCIWKSPYMFAGTDTFISHMLHRAGLKNVIEDERYPEIDIELLKVYKPDIVMLSSEPYPFQQEDADYIESKLSGTKVLLVDGEIFSWYGSRILKAPEYINSLLSQFKTD